MLKKLFLLITVSLLLGSVCFAGNVQENGTNKGAFTDLNFVGCSVSGNSLKTITVDGTVDFELIGTTDTITTADAGKTFIVTTALNSLGEISLPAASGSGSAYTFIDGKTSGTETFWVDPDGTDIIMKSISSAPLAAGEKLTSTGQTGDVLILIDGASGVWYLGGEVGTWTNGG